MLLNCKFGMQKQEGPPPFEALYGLEARIGVSSVKADRRSRADHHKPVCRYLMESSRIVP